MIECYEKTKSGIEEIIEKTVISPEIKIMAVSELLNVDKMDVFGSKLVFINRLIDSIIYVYDTI